MLWHASVIDNDIARAILDEFYALPDSKPDTANELADRMTAKGLHFTNRPGTAITEVHHTGTFGLSG